ncbi:hypothetical protein [Pseudomonas yamanorum]|uniref:hypothetical protein n=1 Tax=Pseudomonas yamanorum TaxID=515393 RepID=UPI003D36BCD1
MSLMIGAEPLLELLAVVDAANQPRYALVKAANYLRRYESPRVSLDTLQAQIPET